MRRSRASRVQSFHGQFGRVDSSLDESDVKMLKSGGTVMQASHLIIFLEGKQIQQVNKLRQPESFPYLDIWIFSKTNFFYF